MAAKKKTRALKRRPAQAAERRAPSAPRSPADEEAEVSAIVSELDPEAVDFMIGMTRNQISWYDGSRGHHDKEKAENARRLIRLLRKYHPSRRVLHDVKRDRAAHTRELADVASGQGWRVERTKSGHWRFVPPDKTKSIVIVPGTSVSRSGARAAVADLRRSGLVLPHRDPAHRQRRFTGRAQRFIDRLLKARSQRPGSRSYVAQMRAADLEWLRMRPVEQASVREYLQGS